MASLNLSVKEKTQIEKEIREAINALIVGCESLDMDLAFRAFSNSPDFLMMGMDGSLYDYQTYIDINISYLKACSRFKLTTYRDEIRIMDRDTVIFSWAYGAEATLKTGEKDIFKKAGASFVFKKAADEWKVVYYHESSTPPIRVPQVK